MTIFANPLSQQHLLRENCHHTDSRASRRPYLTLFHSRPVGRARPLYLVIFLCFIAALPAAAAEKTRLRVDDYQIDAELLPQSHKLPARAKVKFTALEDISVATFQLNNALRVTKLVDEKNKPLSPERITRNPSSKSV